MLLISLAVSAGLLYVANYNVHSSKRPLLYIFLNGLGFSFGPALLFMGLLPVLWQALLLWVACLVWTVCRWKPRAYLPLSLAATAAAYGIAAWFSWQSLSALQETFPYESMEDRLPPPKSLAHASPLPAETKAKLTELEKQIDDETNRDWRIPSRLQTLEELHEQTLLTFISSPGFGAARFIRDPARVLGYSTDDGDPPPPAGKQAPSGWSPGEVEALPGVAPEPDLVKLHRDGTLDFVNLAGFGFVKDRKHVAGFRGHRFNRVPEGPAWKVEALDLVGLVVHERPVAYVSKLLPRMDELKKAPTRPLDDFESLGLAALKKGEDLFVRDVADGRRMLGAVRSAKQCVGCHGGERGDLLGAFSYTLNPAPAK